jgi:hypothetical protein
MLNGRGMSPVLRPRTRLSPRTDPFRTDPLLRHETSQPIAHLILEATPRNRAQFLDDDRRLRRENYHHANQQNKLASDAHALGILTGITLTIRRTAWACRCAPNMRLEFRPAEHLRPPPSVSPSAQTIRSWLLGMCVQTNPEALSLHQRQPPGH